MRRRLERNAATSQELKLAYVGRLYGSREPGVEVPDRLPNPPAGSKPYGWRPCRNAPRA